MPEQQVLDEFVAASEGGAQTQETTPTAEEIEFILGDKTDRLPLNAEFNIPHNGQIVRAPLSKVINGFRLRSKLDEDTQAFKKQQEELEAKMKEIGDIDELRTSVKPYQELQTWSEKLEQENPAAFRHLMTTIDAMKTGLWNEGDTGNTGQLNAVISDLNKQISELKDWRSEQDKAREDAQLAQDMEDVKKEISEFKEFAKTKGIDLNAPHESGLTLENYILKVGAEKGFPTFKSAALTVLEDQLLDTVKNEGRTEAVKGIRGDFKQGVVARSSTPFQGQGQEENVVNLSGEEIKERALQELLSSQDQ